MFIDINGQQISCTTSLGFPQGGVCSAKFWIIAFNAAISILNKHGVLGLGFADDCVALIGGTKLHQMMSRIPHIGDSFVSAKKKSQRRVAHHFEALNLSFQMVYSNKSGDKRFLRKSCFCVSFSDPNFNIFDKHVFFRTFNDLKSTK